MPKDDLSTPWSIRPTDEVRELAENLSETHGISRNDVVKLWLSQTANLIRQKGLKLEPSIQLPNGEEQN